MLKIKMYSIVSNPRVILIESLFHHPWVNLVTFVCFRSNINNLCDLFLPNEITCYVCLLLFSFGFSKLILLGWNLIGLYGSCKQANVTSLNHGLVRKLVNSNPWFAMMHVLQCALLVKSNSNTQLEKLTPTQLEKLTPILFPTYLLQRGSTYHQERSGHICSTQPCGKVDSRSPGSSHQPSHRTACWCNSLQRKQASTLILMINHDSNQSTVDPGSLTPFTTQWLNSPTTDWLYPLITHWFTHSLLTLPTDYIWLHNDYSHWLHANFTHWIHFTTFDKYTTFVTDSSHWLYWLHLTNIQTLATDYTDHWRGGDGAVWTCSSIPHTSYTSLCWTPTPYDRLTARYPHLAPPGKIPDTPVKVSIAHR